MMFFPSKRLPRYALYAVQVLFFTRPNKVPDYISAIFFEIGLAKCLPAKSAQFKNKWQEYRLTLCLGGLKNKNLYIVHKL